MKWKKEAEFIQTSLILESILKKKFMYLIRLTVVLTNAWHMSVMYI